VRRELDHRFKQVWLGVGMALAFCLLGCGGSSAPSNPVTAVGPTQNPQVAQYQVTENGPANIWVEFGPTTAYGRQTSTVPTGTVGGGGTSAQLTTIVVAGMKASTTYHMRAHVDYTSGLSWVDQDQIFTTGALPASSKTSMTVTRPSNSSIQQSGVELLDLTDGAPNNISTAVADLDGNIIWYYPIIGPNFAFPIKPLPDGNMLVNVTGPETANGVPTDFDLREVGLAGNTVRDLTLPALNQKLTTAGFAPIINGSVHHDVCVLPNGHWVVIANTEQTFTNLPGYPGSLQVVGDYLIDLDQNWNPVWVWSAFDHLDVNRHLFGLPDWTHGNALIYDPSDGNLIMSMRNQSWVFKIDYENGAGAGDILWKLGYQGDFTLAGGNDPSEWFYGQHYPFLISSTGSQLTLAIFDDGSGRVLNDSGVTCQGLYPNCYSRATIYTVDVATKVATLAFQDLPNLYTGFGGSIVVLSNGDVDYDVCAPFPLLPVPSARVLEVTQTPNPTLVWQADISGGFAYRAYRIPSLYPGVTWTQ
jgi:arylsulfate sulfotransferase